MFENVFFFEVELGIFCDVYYILVWKFLEYIYVKFFIDVEVNVIVVVDFSIFENWKIILFVN